MRIEFLPGYTVLLTGEPRVTAWLWGFKKYGETTARRRAKGHHGFTVRLGTNLVIVTLPGKGHLG